MAGKLPSYFFALYPIIVTEVYRNANGILQDNWHILWVTLFFKKNISSATQL